MSHGDSRIKPTINIPYIGDINGMPVEIERLSRNEYQGSIVLYWTDTEKQRGFTLVRQTVAEVAADLRNLHRGHVGGAGAPNVARLEVGEAIIYTFRHNYGAISQICRNNRMIHQTEIGLDFQQAVSMARTWLKSQNAE